MRRRRIQLVHHNCPRCGRPTARLSRSLFGADAAHAKYAGLCHGCTTDAERDEMLAAQAGALLRKAATP